MKTTMIAATIALGLTAGAALADQPMVLTETQLDRVTAGQGLVEYAIILMIIPTDNEISVGLTAAEEAGQTVPFTSITQTPAWGFVIVK